MTSDDAHPWPVPMELALRPNLQALHWAGPALPSGRQAPAGARPRSQRGAAPAGVKPWDGSSAGRRRRTALGRRGAVRFLSCVAMGADGLDSARLPCLSTGLSRPAGARSSCCVPSQPVGLWPQPLGMNVITCFLILSILTPSPHRTKHWHTASFSAFPRSLNPSQYCTVR